MSLRDSGAIWLASNLSHTMLAASQCLAQSGMLACQSLAPKFEHFILAAGGH